MSDKKAYFLFLYNKNFVVLVSQQKGRRNIFTHFFASSSLVFLKKYNWKSYFLNQPHHHFPVFLSGYFLFHKFYRKFTHPHNIVCSYEYKHRNQNHTLENIYFKQKNIIIEDSETNKRRDKTYLKKNKGE